MPLSCENGNIAFKTPSSHKCFYYGVYASVYQRTDMSDCQPKRTGGALVRKARYPNLVVKTSQERPIEELGEEVIFSIGLSS